MSWFFIALLAQFVLGTASVFDKLLLKKSYPNPVGYTFWVGMLGLASLALIPFGFEQIPAELAVFAIGTGALFMAALFLFFWALFYGEASGAVVSISGLSPVATLVFSAFLLGTILSPYQLASFLFLILGGFLLAFTAPQESRLRVVMLVFASALLFGISNALSRQVFDAAGFITGFVWLKTGGALMVLLFLFYAPWRRRIFGTEKADEFKNKWGYVANRAYAGLGSLLIYYAISLGEPPLIDAMQAVRFLFVFLGGWLLLGERFRGKILALKISAFIVVSLGVLLLGAGDYAQRTAPDPERTITWGVTFSEKFSRKFDFGDAKTWKDNYDAILDDLGARQLRLIAYWDLIEPAAPVKGEPRPDGTGGREEHIYDFSGLDYQMRRAEEEGADVILVVGKKAPRWPECHNPRWVGEIPISKNKFPNERDEKLFEFVEAVVNRYKGSSAIKYWQVENEPFLPFGEGDCALSGKALLDAEIERVRMLDPDTPILITDSGELGLWALAAKRGDVFGTTMYRRVHNDTLGNFEYPIGPAFFRIKEKIVRFLIWDYEKKFLVIELGMEPWLKRQPYETAPEEQFEVFDFEFFQDSARFAKDAGFSEYYLWGAEWWYWMREQNGDNRFWEEAKKLML
jgi:drug/metabolite transporter (DMT)-like permease